MAELIAPQATKLTCVDPSPAMLAAGRERVAALKLTGVYFVEGTGEQLPLTDDSADSALFLQSLQYMTDPGQALTDATRVLAPGGRLLIVTLAKHEFHEAEAFGHRHRGFSSDQLKRWTKGLTDHHLDVLPGEPRSPHFQTVILTARKRT